MAEQRQRAQQASNFGTDYNQQVTSEQSTNFKGYTQDSYTATVVELFVDGQSVNSLSDGQTGLVVLDDTPFYAESGGQVGDAGVIKTANGVEFLVQDTVKLGKAFAHKGTVKGVINLHDKVDAEIDVARRQAIVKNHSATHLLHATLRSVLGEHVTQKGSLCEPDKLRFDFSHFEAVTAKELRQVERIVNQEIRSNHQRDTKLMNIEAAKAAGAMALFGEKYDDEVRVVSLGDNSTELCGGVHVNRSGDIGLFKITSEQGIAAGVRRIEAVTGEAAIAYTEQQADLLSSVSGLVKSDVTSVAEKVEQLLSRNKQLEKELNQLKQTLASQAGSDLLNQTIEVKGVKALIANLEGVEAKSLRGMVDELKNKMGSGILMLATANGDKVSLIAGVTKDLTGQVKAGELVNFVAKQVGGKGGGRPDMAQAGGTEPQNINNALAGVEAWLTEQLS